MPKPTKTRQVLAWLPLVLFAGTFLAGNANALPLSPSTQKVYPTDGRVADEASFSVALSGNVAVLGAHLADPLGSDSGAAYVFRRNGNSWVEAQKLVAADGAAGDRFGTSVAVGPTFILVGAAYDDDRGTDSGSVYVFRLNGTTWTQSQKITATEGAAGEMLGNSIALSGDHAVVGAYGSSAIASYAGAAYTFRYNGQIWVQGDRLLPVGANSGEGFGKSVGVSGSFAIIGSYQDDAREHNAGAASMFKYSNGRWNAHSKLTASDGGPYQVFGSSVQIADGVAVVGAPKDDDLGYMSGSAYIFRHNVSSDQWVQEAKLLDPDGDAGDTFGASVTVAGTKVVIGAPGWDDRTIEFPNKDQGAGCLFTFSGSSWTAQSRFLATDGYYFDGMTSSIAMSGDTVLAGASKEDARAMDSGSGYFFTASGPAPECVTNADCNDSNPCTTDTCSTSGTCQHGSAPNGTSCNDGVYCNGADTCSAGACTVHAGNPCASGPICANTCNEAADNCLTAANIACTADTNACTNDVCNGSGTCTHPIKPAGSACGSSVVGLCDNADTCSASGVCQSNNLANGTACADDGNECTNDTCSAGQCTHPARPNNTACTADTNTCTNDVCTAGVCSHPNKAAGSACGSSSAGLCDNPDTCNASGVCQLNRLANGNACADDGNECTNDICSNGVCTHPTRPNNTPCEDGNLCTEDDKCAAGVCRSGPAVTCDDSDPCTVDTCGPKGCRSAPLVCPAGQSCMDGTCSNQNIAGCNDGVCAATEDACNCPADCLSFEVLCGNGVCDAYVGEDCRTCPEDCRGILSGPPGKQFCCGDHDSDATCESSACNTRSWTCIESACGDDRR